MRWTRRKAERFSRMIGRMLCIRYPVPLISHFVTAFPRGGSQEPHPYLLLRGEGGEASASRMRWSCRKAERFLRIHAVSPKTKTSPRTVRRPQDARRRCAARKRLVAQRRHGDARVARNGTYVTKRSGVGARAFTTEHGDARSNARRHLCNEAQRSGQPQQAGSLAERRSDGAGER